MPNPILIKRLQTATSLKGKNYRLRFAKDTHCDASGIVNRRALGSNAHSTSDKRPFKPNLRPSANHPPTPSGFSSLREHDIARFIKHNHTVVVECLCSKPPSTFSVFKVYVRHRMRILSFSLQNLPQHCHLFHTRHSTEGTQCNMADRSFKLSYLDRALTE